MPRTETGGWGRQPPSRRDAERGAALVRWLDTEVRPFSLWWRERLRGIPVGGLDDLSALPVLERAEAVRAGGPGNPGLLVLASEDGFKRHASRGEVAALARELGRGLQARRAALLRRYQPVHVHEAGAPPLAIAYTRTDLDRLHLAGARLAQVLGLASGDGLVSVVPPGPSIRFWGLYHAALAARVTALHPRSGGEPAAAAASRALSLLPATVLAVAVDEADELLYDLAQSGRRLPTLRSVLTVGRPPTAIARAALVEAAERLAGRKVDVQAVWAPEAARALWGEPPSSPQAAPAGPGLHTYPDLEVLEVRSQPGHAARSGGPGELLCTSLGWRGTVAVRLATDARINRLIDDEPCPVTGRTVPRVLASPAAAGGFDVRAVHQEELDAAAAVVVSAYRTLLGAGLSSDYAAVLADVADRAAKAEVLVAVEDGRVLGCVTYVGGQGPYAEFPDDDAAGIRMLAVAPGAEGRGIGTALVRACLDRARAAGRARVVLHSQEEMATAQRIYAREGFVRASARDVEIRPGLLLLGYERAL